MMNRRIQADFIHMFKKKSNFIKKTHKLKNKTNTMQKIEIQAPKNNLSTAKTEFNLKCENNNNILQ